jgi:concentrative nucleoside transporter, CNT family
MERFQSLLGILAFVGLAYVFSSNKKQVSLKFIFKALLIQLILALLLIGIPGLRVGAPLFFIFDWANTFVSSIILFTEKGTQFLFGPLADPKQSGFILAIQVLPSIIFFSSLSAILYYLKILPFIISGFSKILKKNLKVSGAETLSVVANIFVGQTEAPLVVKPLLPSMTRSELFTVMVGGMATVAGGVMISYVGFLSGTIPDIAGHLVIASVLSAPAALLFSKILIPETEVPVTANHVPDQVLVKYENLIDAAASGASDGLKLMANVAAMLIAFIALIYMADSMIMHIGDWLGFQSWGQFLTPESLKTNGETKLTLSLILSWIFLPFSFLLGLQPDELFYSSSLLGKKVVFNEFISYLDLSQAGDKLSLKSKIIMSYALCGFANFSSIAIQVGGIGALAPNQRANLAQLGLRSVLGGTLACFVTACFASLLY